MNTKQKNRLGCALIILFLHTFFASYMYAQINTNLPVGAIPGAIDVSPMGAATYTIPIEVVPGTQGIQPNLSIVYNSYSGMGILGMKWHLSGLSAITRCGQTPYYDGNITAIQFNGNDRFAIDGAQLLMQNNGNYGGLNATYATEVENFIRVVSHGGAAAAPDYFMVYTDDGSAIEYGKTSNAKQTVGTNKVLSWLINKITDANGNFMTYTYESVHGDIRIKEIHYTGNASAGLSTYANVQFSYINNTLNPSEGFISECFIKQTKLLDAITVRYGNSVVRKYKFNYNLHISGERTAHLKEIVLYGEGATTPLNATAIEWGAQKTEIDVSQIVPLGDVNKKVLTGDFNGDGFTDAIVYGDGTWQLFLKNQYSETFNPSVVGQYYSSNNHVLYAYDINGDGKDELIVGVNTTDGKWMIFNRYKFKDDGAMEECYMGSFDYFKDVIFGRFRSSGLPDMFVYTIQKIGSEYYHRFKNMSGDIVLTIVRKTDDKFDIYVTNLYGDGRDYLQVIKDNSAYTYKFESGAFQLAKYNGFPTKWHKVYYGDFNGDGIKDALVYRDITSSSKEWQLFLGIGNNNYAHPGRTMPLHPLSQSIAAISEPKFPVIVADLNGDGKDEIFQVMGTTMTCFSLSNFTAGGNCSIDITTIDLAGSYIHSSQNTFEYHLGDFNGDGKVDIMIYNLFGGPRRIVYANKNEEYELVTKITDGMGKFYELSYRPKYFRAKSVTLSSGTKTYTTHQKYFLPTVKFLKTQNGVTTDLRFLSYIFEGAMYSLPKRTFLGFETFEVYNNSEKLFEVSKFGTVGLNLKQMLVPKSYTFKCDGNTTNSKTFFYTVVDLPNNRYVVNSAHTTENDHLLDTKTITTHTLNNQGRVIESNTKTYNQRTAYENDWFHSEKTTCFYKGITLSNTHHKKTVPEKILTTQQYKSNNNLSPSVTDTVTNEYNSLGNLTKMRKGNIDGVITTQFSNYYTTGVAGKKTVLAQGLSSEETYIYYPNQRFVKHVINQLNDTATFTYNDKTGNILTEKDPNGLITTFTYNAFGNLTNVLYPDNTQTSVQVKWYTGSAIPNARYFTETTTTGKPVVEVYYDILGREVRRKDDGKYFDTRYNARGLVEKTSYPYTNLNELDQNKIWNTFTYDIYGRELTTKAPYTDLAYSYAKRKVTVTDKKRNNIKNHKDYDALGRIIEAKDEGGTITYTYEIVLENNKPRHKTTINAPISGNTTSPPPDIRGNPPTGDPNPFLDDNEPLPIIITHASTIIFSDLWGNRLSITEPNAGTITSTYNKFNELIQQTDARGCITKYQYDPLGRITQKQYIDPTAPSQTKTINYSYYNSYTSTNKGKGKLHKIQIDGVDAEIYTYDKLSRLKEHNKIIDKTHFPFHYTYNTNGQLDTLTYPGGFGIRHSYTFFGHLKNIKPKNFTSNIYSVESRNIYNAPLQCSFGHNGVTRTDYTYNPYGLLTHIRTYDKQTPVIIIKGATNNLTYTVGSNMVNYRYDYDSKGLMTLRVDSTLNRWETFTYDNLDRLTQVSTGIIGQTNGTVQHFSFTKDGNFANHAGVGSYLYNPTDKPHAVSKVISINGSVFSENQCDVTYNAFNQPTQIVEGEYRLELFYGANQQRNKTMLYHNNTLVATRYYISKRYEEEHNYLTNTIRRYYYVYGDNGAVALNIRTQIGSSSADTMYYIHSDHLGSYNAITNASAKVVQRNHFDVWGNPLPVYASTDTLKTTPLNFTLTNRGFTGHEHYPFFKIINMNGRLYDPVIARFFSPDKYVVNSSFTQDFNRYTYARNNPLMYTDPSGEFLVWSIGPKGLSIGINFTPWGVPLGLGINIGWSNGGSIGFYGEVAYRVGGTGLGAGAGINQSIDYSFGSRNWTTTTGANAYGSFLMFNVGVNGSYGYDITNKQGDWGWGVSVGINAPIGNDAYGIGLGISYGSGGWSWNLGGYYNPWAWQDNPTYEPDKWNDNGDKQLTNNCYTYALDDIDNGNRRGLNPGYSGEEYRITSYDDLTLDYVLNGAISDGRIRKPNFWNKLGFGKRGYYSVYLVIDEGVDYHWYRQDKGGNWSHKPGTTRVINFDASGRPISNPANANHIYPHAQYNNGAILLWVRRR